MTEFDSIRPFSDQEAVEAIERMSRNPFLSMVSKYLFPDLPSNTFKKLIKGVNSVDEFQEVVMSKVVSAVISRSSSGFSYEGLENIADMRSFLAVSNHRDITLDPALVQWMMLNNNKPFMEICVGSNLLSGNKLIADLLRCNRMIKVIRGISARQLYLSSKLLSSYIRQTIVTGSNSIWIAQKEGRTKNGLDLTEQGLLKMFDMSGTSNFKDNFSELNIVPMSISYEYEPCDAKKARELYLSKRGPYIKKRKEDTHSIVTGISQWKGGIHLHIDKALTDSEILEASECHKNDRYQALRAILNRRIVLGYKLWKTNYIAYDLLNNGSKYASFYTIEDVDNFKHYVDRKLNKLERRLNRDELREIFLQIYANPVVAKEELA